MPSVMRVRCARETTGSILSDERRTGRGKQSSKRERREKRKKRRKTAEMKEFAWLVLNFGRHVNWVSISERRANWDLNTEISLPGTSHFDVWNAQTTSVRCGSQGQKARSSLDYTIFNFFFLPAYWLCCVHMNGKNTEAVYVVAAASEQMQYRSPRWGRATRP